MPGIDLIYDITEIFQMHNIETEIIAASVRNPIHVIDCAKAGADIATVPYKVLEQMTKHPLTDQGIAKFQADYKAYLVNKVEEKTASKSPETDLQVSLYTGFRIHLFACIGLCPLHSYSCAQECTIDICKSNGILTQFF